VNSEPPIELAPARASFSAAGWVGLVADVGAVVAPVPAGAVVVPGRVVSARLVGSILAAAITVALAVIGLVSPAVLGAGVGAEVGLLWRARKISQFEREDGRRVLRAVRRRWGQPALYAAD
jgi:hypothetical protein